MSSMRQVRKRPVVSASDKETISAIVSVRRAGKNSGSVIRAPVRPQLLRLERRPAGEAEPLGLVVVFLHERPGKVEPDRPERGIPEQADTARGPYPHIV